MSFQTDNAGNAYLVIAVATTTRTATTTVLPLGLVSGSAAPNSWVAILDSSGALVANVSTDAFGAFSTRIPYRPNTGFKYQAGGGSGSGMFTTDYNGNAHLLIPPATSSRTSTTTVPALQCPIPFSATLQGPLCPIPGLLSWTPPAV